MLLVPFLLRALRWYLGRRNRRGCKAALGDKTESTIKEDLSAGLPGRGQVERQKGPALTA